MPSSYTVNLGLEKPATGEQAGVWGTTANKSYDFLDIGIDGNVTIQLSASGYTLMTNQGVDSNGRNKVIIFTGALSADGSINIQPNTAEKIYFILNQTTGGFGLLISQGTGATYRIAPGKSAVIYTDGLAGAAGVYGVLANFQCDSLLANTITVTNLAFSGASTIGQAVSFTAGVTISPSLVLNLGGDATGDTYYRNSSGQVARLPIGTAGQVLGASASGPVWQTTPPPSLGMPITGSAANLVYFANSAVQLAQDGNFQWVPGSGLGIGMPPAAAVTVGRSTMGATIALDSLTNAPNPPTNLRQLLYTSANVPRWSLRTSGEIENVGTNVASNLQLLSFNDAASSANVNQAWYRSGRSSFGAYGERVSQVTIYNTQPGQTGLEVIGAPGQTGFLQTWLNNSGTVVASLDNAGNFVSAVGSGFLKLDGNKRLDINGTVAGHPLGTIHLGADAVGSQPNPSIVMEGGNQFGNPILGGNSVRMYVRTAVNPRFVIQFSSGGTAYYAYVDLLPGSGGAVTWYITSNPV